jgi:hypothetical protein
VSPSTYSRAGAVFCFSPIGIDLMSSAESSLKK